MARAFDEDKAKKYGWKKLTIDEFAKDPRWTRPRCLKCGKPDVLWFVGDSCEHIKEGMR